MILVDTGPLVAAANRKDTYHAASVAALAAAHPPRLVPGLVIADYEHAQTVTTRPLAAEWKVIRPDDRLLT